MINLSKLLASNTFRVSQCLNIECIVVTEAVLKIDKSKVTTLGVLAIFEQVYKIDAGKIPVSKFDIPLDDKYKIRD